MDESRLAACSLQKGLPPHDYADEAQIFGTTRARIWQRAICFRSINLVAGTAPWQGSEFGVRKRPKIIKNQANFEGSGNIKNVREFFREGPRGVDFVVVVTVSEKKLRGKKIRAEGPKIFSESAVVVVVVVVVVELRCKIN